VEITTPPRNYIKNLYNKKTRPKASFYMKKIQKI